MAINPNNTVLELKLLNIYREMAGGGAVGLLQALLSTDNDIRSKAEESYEALPVEQRVSFIIPFETQTLSSLCPASLLM